MMSFFVSIAHAQSASPGLDVATDFVARVNEVILYPLIALLMGLALLIFLYGCYEYISHSAESSAREKGQMHIIWGIVGLFIMLVAYGILGIAAGTFGLGDNLDCYNDPSQAGCDFLLVPDTGVTGGNTGGTTGGNTGGTTGGNTGGASGGNFGPQ
jgi:uncharacterized membrane protein YidH (DUF202 family)